MSHIEEFSATLESLLTVKPPGVSGSRIRKLTRLALDSVQAESVLVQKLFTHYKKTPAANKLGALYVVDAIVRAYYDEAKRNNQSIGPSDNVAAEGTFASGVNHISDIIEVLIDDFVATHPSIELVEKALKVITLWEKGTTFPESNVASMRQKLEKLRDEDKDGIPLLSTTPPGSPPPHIVAALASNFANLGGKKTTANTKNKSDTASILQALASISKTSAPADPSNAASSAPPSLPPLPPPPLHNDGRQHRHRSRSPRGRGEEQPQSLSRSNNNSGTGDKLVTYDDSLPPGTIRVFSRTLFVGGILPYMTENDINDIFAPFARLQSIVFQKEKKHAFVKVYKREEAITAIAKLEELLRANKTTLRARWGVGFGPRDCCDYASGVSIIPLDRLTESDKKWAVSSEWGGTGGIPLKEKICIEEPDIQIGSGVSSKAVSNRMPTDGSRNGPRASRGELENIGIGGDFRADRGGDRYRDRGDERYGNEFRGDRGGRRDIRDDHRDGHRGGDGRGRGGGERGGPDNSYGRRDSYEGDNRGGRGRRGGGNGDGGARYDRGLTGYDQSQLPPSGFPIGNLPPGFPAPPAGAIPPEIQAILANMHQKQNQQYPPGGFPTGGSGSAIPSNFPGFPLPSPGSLPHQPPPPSSSGALPQPPSAPPQAAGSNQGVPNALPPELLSFMQRQQQLQQTQQRQDRR